jgi:DNA-binding response OmpR family regulator
MEKKKILIVDDDRDLLIGLQVRLRANNYATVVACDAASALAQARKERPDLILLDLGLPDENGFIVMENLKDARELSAIPVVVVSGLPPHVYKDPALIAGAAAFLQKPVDNDQLLATIRKTLEGSPST